MITTCSKAIREENYKDNDRLIEEVGDVLCMIELMKNNDVK